MYFLLSAYLIYSNLKMNLYNSLTRLLVLFCISHSDDQFQFVLQQGKRHIVSLHRHLPVCMQPERF